MGTKKELPRITIMNLLDLFDLSFVGRRNSIALEFENRKTQTATYTFGDLDRQSNRIAGLLESRSLKTGDRLCIYLANCPEMIVIYLACLKLGVVLVPINILYKNREIAHFGNSSTTRGIGERALADMLADPPHFR